VLHFRWGLAGPCQAIASRPGTQMSLPQPATLSYPIAREIEVVDAIWVGTLSALLPIALHKVFYQDPTNLACGREAGPWPWKLACGREALCTDITYHHNPYCK
jgi:hypothetical protein